MSSDDHEAVSAEREESAPRPRVAPMHPSACPSLLTVRGTGGGRPGFVCLIGISSSGALACWSDETGGSGSLKLRSRTPDAGYDFIRECIPHLRMSGEGQQRALTAEAEPIRVVAADLLDIRCDENPDGSSMAAALSARGVDPAVIDAVSSPGLTLTAEMTCPEEDGEPTETSYGMWVQTPGATYGVSIIRSPHEENEEVAADTPVMRLALRCVRPEAIISTLARVVADVIRAERLIAVLGGANRLQGSSTGASGDTSPENGGLRLIVPTPTDHGAPEI